jgi:uncharacterized protein
VARGPPRFDLQRKASPTVFDEHPDGSNTSGNPSISDLIDARVGRRRFLQGAAAAGLAGVLASQLPAGAASAAGATGSSTAKGVGRNRSKLGFEEVLPSDQDTIVVPPGYVWSVLIPWGTPLFANSPAFAEDASNTAAEQAMQVGFNHDGMHYFPDRRNGSKQGLLVLNHEYTDANQIYSATAGSAITPDAAGREKVAKALAAHGVTVVEVARDRHANWSHVQGSRFNRRITGTTPMAFSGPVSANHPMLQSPITPNPIGTLNNCAMGYTPWGTYLACEENWNGYFGTADSTWTATPLESRYGVSAGGFGYNWHVAEPRFDLAANRNELNHFGWVVEFDPHVPSSTPVKRTALGRIKHEGATVTESRGRAVVYTGDDENGDYLYKFVGDLPWKSHIARGQSPLDHGTLYVAVFDGEGGGTWVPLVHGAGPLTVANGWADQADVLIRTRMAADAVGATRLHRPEWVSVDEKTKDVYLTLTNGGGNNAPVNSSRDPNPYGHVIKITEDRGDNTQLTFRWDIFVLAGDPAYDAAVPAGQPVFGSPDGIWVDPDSRVWIETDISNSSQNLASRGYDNIKNNQILVADPDTGEVKRFLTGPRGCEMTGIVMTPDMRTLFVNVQHPGESTTFWNNQFGAPSVANPTTVSTWPFGGRPRPATVVIRKADGGVIGY